MDNVVFSATTRNGKFFEVEDDGGKVDRYTIRQDGSTNYVDTPNQILGELVMQTEWKEGTFEKILVDKFGIGKEYLQIVKMIRAKYNWLEKLPKGSEGRIFYFNIGRYFRNGLYKNVPSDKIFKMIDDYIATYNFKEDVKSKKKVLKEFVEIDAKIQVHDSDGKLTRQYNNAIKKMINIVYDIDLEQFDFDKVATGNCKELDNLVIKLCNQSGLNSKDIYSMLWDRFQDEYGVDFEFDIYDIFESTKSEKKTLKESVKSESIVAKLSKEFLGYNVGIVSEVDGVEDSITVGIDNGFGKNRDKNKSRDIYNYVAKELRGYADTKVTYDSASEMCIINFYNVSSYSDRELIQTIEDIVWNVNAKFDIKEV